MNPFKDITTREGTNEPRLAEDKLRRLHQLGLAVADTETTGLDAGKNGLTELAAVRAMRVSQIKKLNASLPEDQRIEIADGLPDDAIRLIQFQSFILPYRALSEDLFTGSKRRRYSDEERRWYEYEVNNQAFVVTGSELEYDAHGNIAGMKVNTHSVDASRNAGMVMDAYMAFTDNGQRDAYFNATFDKRFLAAKLTEREAYLRAKRGDHLMKDLAVSLRLPAALQKPYEDLSTEQKFALIGHIQKLMVNQEISEHQFPGFSRSAEWSCAMEAFRAAYPQAKNHTLDTFKEMMGVAGAERKEHSAIEDVLLTTEGMLEWTVRHSPQATPYLPRTSELMGFVLQRSHGLQAHSRPAENGKDVNIFIPGVASSSDLPPDSATIAREIEAYLKSVERARPADPLAPPKNSAVAKIFECFEQSEEGLQFTASGTGKRPRFLSLLKNLSFTYQTLRDYPWVQQMRAYDRPGTFVDVTIDGQVVEDVPWNILRRNVAYLNEAPSDESRIATLKLLRDIEAKNPQIGGVKIMNDHGQRSIRLYGHVRSFGTVDIPWPENITAEDAGKIILPKLELITGLGILPYGERSTLDDSADDGDDDAKREKKDLACMRTTMDVLSEKPRYTLKIDARIFKLFKAALPPEMRGKYFDKIIYTDKGEGIAIGQENGMVTLQGSAEAFNSFIVKEEKGREKPVAIAEKPINILRDAAWLLHRLEQIPNADLDPKTKYKVEVRDVAETGDDGIDRKAYRIVVKQGQRGTSTEALALLQSVKIPHTAEKDQITFSAGALMQDAFHWSLGLARAQKDETYQPLLAETSIVPSLAKGLQEATEGEEKKRLQKVFFHPQLGLTLHYRDEKIYIPNEKMLARTLPQGEDAAKRNKPSGRRRVQRIFARLQYAPEQTQHVDKTKGTVWNIRLSALEAELLTHALSQKPEAKNQITIITDKEIEGQPATFVVIHENDLTKRESPAFEVMKTVSDSLAAMQESTGIEQWFFQPNMFFGEDGNVTLRLPQRADTLFQHASGEIVVQTSEFLKNMHPENTPEETLQSRIQTVLGTRGARSALHDMHLGMRREAKLKYLIQDVRNEHANLQALQAQCSQLAGGIVTEAQSSEEGAKGALALAHHLAQDRISVAQMISACETMQRKARESGKPFGGKTAEEWRDLRNKAIRAEDKMAEAIHGVDRLKEALNTGARTIANGSGSWNKSLIGAMIHAEMDCVLDDIYLEAGDKNAEKVREFIRKKYEELEAYGVKLEKKPKSKRVAKQETVDPDDLEDVEDTDEEKPVLLHDEVEDGLAEKAFPNLIREYAKNAALRLLVRAVHEENDSKKTRLMTAAHHAFVDAGVKNPEWYIALYEGIQQGTLSDAKAQDLIRHNITAKCLDELEVQVQEALWIAKLALGRAKPEDVRVALRSDGEPQIQKRMQKAYRKTGRAYLFEAAELHRQSVGLENEIAALQQSNADVQAIAIKQNELAHVQCARDICVAQGMNCYQRAGSPESSAKGIFTNLKNRALNPQHKANAKTPFAAEYLKKHAFLQLSQQRNDIVNYTVDAQEEIMIASILQNGGEEELHEFYHRKLPGVDRIVAHAAAINVMHPEFVQNRQLEHRRNILKAKDRMFEELDDLNKMEYHVRQDLEALRGLMEQVRAPAPTDVGARVLAAGESPTHPERFGLEGTVSALREGMRTLDAEATRHSMQFLASRGVQATPETGENFSKITFPLAQYLGAGKAGPESTTVSAATSLKRSWVPEGLIAQRTYHLAMDAVYERIRQTANELRWVNLAREPHPVLTLDITAAAESGDKALLAHQLLEDRLRYAYETDTEMAQHVKIHTSVDKDHKLTAPVRYEFINETDMLWAHWAIETASKLQELGNVRIENGKCWVQLPEYRHFNEDDLSEVLELVGATASNLDDVMEEQTNTLSFELPSVPHLSTISHAADLNTLLAEHAAQGRR